MRALPGSSSTIRLLARSSPVWRAATPCAWLSNSQYARSSSPSARAGAATAPASTRTPCSWTSPSPTTTTSLSTSPACACGQREGPVSQTATSHRRLRPGQA
eukprot:10284304-Heterocapsa_arctica.AAC.1